MTQFHRLTDLDLSGKTVLLRVDLNVPKQDGKVTDTTRIDRLKPTIDLLRSKGARTLLLSHFGRPKGERQSSLSLAFLISALEASWETSVQFCQDCIGESAEAMAGRLQDGDVALLENVRFHSEETANDPAFVAALAKLGDVYINDAFSVSHRAHASTEGLAHVLPCAAGLLMEAELTALSKALDAPERPLAAIVGGSKISTKLTLLNNLVKKVDCLILGGGMANTFLLAQGAQMGSSLVEADMLEDARQIFDTAKAAGCTIFLPKDFICVKEIHSNADVQIVPSSDIPADHMAIDIGPETTTALAQTLATYKTVLWNGPMGVFEIKPFDTGTNALAQYVGERTSAGDLVSVAGGGDTVAALENAGAASAFTYISTAGGAFLEWMEGKELPGVAALKV